MRIAKKVTVNLLCIGVTLVVLCSTLCAQEAAPQTEPPQGEAKSSLEKLVVLFPDSMTATDVFVRELDSAMQEDRQVIADGKVKPRPEDFLDSAMTTPVVRARNGDTKQMFALFAAMSMRYMAYERELWLPIALDTAQATTDLAKLERICVRNGARFVAVIPSLAIVRSGSDTVMMSRLYLYDRDEKSIVLEELILAGTDNPGFMFGCAEGSFRCLINNTMQKVNNLILRAMYARDNTIRRARVVAEDRTAFITGLYDRRSTDFKWERDALAATPALRGLYPYLTIVSQDSNKFIAFVHTRMTMKEEMATRDGTGTHRVNMSQNAFTGGGVDGKMPFFMAVAALRDSGTWYVKSYARTFPDSAGDRDMRVSFVYSTIGDRYFAKNLTTMNSNFWSEFPFDRVEDVTKTEEWTKYRDVHEGPERRDRPYIGWYRIVAEATQEVRKRELTAKSRDVTINIMRPFLKTLPKNWVPYEAVLVDTAFEFILAPDLQTWIAAVPGISTSGDTTIRYYCWLPSAKTMYQWTRLEDVPPKYKSWTSTVVASMETISKWNYSHPTYDDPDFWRDHVFAKKGKQYQYLKPLRKIGNAKR